MSTPTSNLKPLKPGERPPRGSGNMAIVRRCATEILALQESKLDFDRLAICQILTDAFSHPDGQITPQRLSNYLSAVLKMDTPDEKCERMKQVEKLKGDIEQIKTNLRIRAANYKKESLWSMNDRRQSTTPTTVQQNSSRSAASSVKTMPPTQTPDKPAIEVVASDVAEDDPVIKKYNEVEAYVLMKHPHRLNPNNKQAFIDFLSSDPKFMRMTPFDIYRLEQVNNLFQ